MDASSFSPHTAKSSLQRSEERTKKEARATRNNITIRTPKNFIKPTSFQKYRSLLIKSRLIIPR